ncbi:MAG: tRNA (N(6)-L-threonylcarbamoyladenosine(37)-C(2))-methylthiotransferase MtaB [Desulfobacteraceae bacterium]|nr:tRNA (N(6)-L-threonylcarbamoyladenosine(37)-C(2))-methylthiotransferase MtaB [Desulfobacteraceae bacterium]
MLRRRYGCGGRLDRKPGINGIMNKTLQTITLGCKVNQAESEALAAWCRDLHGWRIGSRGYDAKLCIINTCTVTARAEMQSRQAVRKAVRTHPEAVIVVTGCGAQRDPGSFAQIKGVDYIIGHADKHRIPEILNHSQNAGGFSVPGKFGRKPQIFNRDISDYKCFEPMPSPAAGGRTRPFLKIQDGCDSFCTYCIVPHTRGRSRSLEPELAVSEFRKLVSAGAPEIVLSGVHIGRYGQDLTPATRLENLLGLIETIEGGHRIRLSSVEPAELTDELLGFIAESRKICPHFHIPLQSGDSEVLKRMHRTYAPEDFLALTGKIRDMFPDAAIGADVLIGFPGESNKAFARTLKLIEQSPVTYLHVFPYSPRPATPAARFPDRVQTGEIKERCRIMRELGRDKKREFFSRMAGKILDVVIEKTAPEDNSLAKGLSANYIPVIIENAEVIEAMRIPCRITSADSDRAVTGRTVLKAGETGFRDMEHGVRQAHLKRENP